MQMHYLILAQAVPCCGVSTGELLVALLTTPAAWALAGVCALLVWGAGRVLGEVVRRRRGRRDPESMHEAFAREHPWLLRQERIKLAISEWWWRVRRRR